MIAGKQYREMRRAAAGFTLLELLVVLTILVMLAALVGPPVLKQLDKAKVDSARVQIKDLENAAGIFKLDVGRYPTTQEGLEALIAPPGSVKGWNGPYLSKSKALPLDPWKHPYQYEAPGKHGDVDIYSLGADSAAGGEGLNADIGNWE